MQGFDEIRRLDSNNKIIDVVAHERPLTKVTTTAILSATLA